MFKNRSNRKHIKCGSAGEKGSLMGNINFFKVWKWILLYRQLEPKCSPHIQPILIYNTHTHTHTRNTLHIWRNDDTEMCAECWWWWFCKIKVKWVLEFYANWEIFRKPAVIFSSWHTFHVPYFSISRAKFFRMVLA